MGPQSGEVLEEGAGLPHAAAACYALAAGVGSASPPAPPRQESRCRVRTVVVLIRPPGCVHVQPERLINKSQPSPSRQGSMSHHCLVLMIRAAERREAVSAGLGASATHAAPPPAPASA